ncbi:MAG: 50S ribosomal protein L11 methyltransferase [Deltaproteobacteria bacterium]|nr:50S ribosomal protein L11 methyltransferase [Deltaproteobacteria bacterium]MBW2082704.1 50S ribosomal protein L11 methyltransferase [Deltaproteobacteria bacterium]
MTSRPYEKLYVYLLDGVASLSDEKELGSFFIGNWKEGNNSFLFFSRPSRDKVDMFLESRPELKLLDEYEMDYDQWQGQGLERLDIAGFSIVPFWLVNEETPKSHGTIILDPGVVFGNGLHPTTQDCLRAVRWIMESATVESVLDLGTGTGILAIAAAHLGASRVLAIDLNPLCAKTAQRNVLLNGLEDVIEVREGAAQEFLRYRADLVLANLDYGVIADLLKNEAMRDKPGFVFSGLLRTPYRELRSLLDQYGIEVVKEWDHEMTWFTVAGKGRGVGRQPQLTFAHL